ncbi:MAG: hypothetical protein NZ928_05335 [Endomicrobia bacterium]|nr:hypothetical protein [Endomicrobiia bacterium]MDW8056470.1 hypothetical protein [Elusimicrobiota bacterium]
MKNKKIIMLTFLSFLTLFVMEDSAVLQETVYYPTFITGSGVPINEYTLFANSGWDGNWYVGTNMCWIKQFKKELLPQKDLFSKLYVGVKLGRAKTKPKIGAPPWEKEIIDGNIYIGVSSTPAWKVDQRYFLCKISDIPTEGDWENAITTTGESVWFYKEVPIDKISFDNDIWVCVYSNTPELTSVSSAPVLAGGWRERQQKDSVAWLNNEINGSPPTDPTTSLKTQIRAFDPAIILKLIPKGSENLEVKLQIASIVDGRENNFDEKVFYITSLTPNIYRLWMEVTQDKKEYKKISRYLYVPPYVFNLNIPMIPQEINGDFWLRFTAEDIFGNVGHTQEIQLNITRTQQQKQQQQTSPQEKKRKK